MAFIRTVRILEIWKKEQYISKIIKEERGRILKDVVLEDEKMLLKFSETKESNKKTVVKQFSKQKHKDVNICISNFLRSKSHELGWSEWKIIKKIELPDIWLIFFERNI